MLHMQNSSFPMLLKAFRICDICTNFVFRWNSKFIVLKDMMGSVILDVHLYRSQCLFSFFFNVFYLFLGQRETEHERGRGRERGRRRIGNRLQAPSHQPRAWRGARTHGPRDRDLAEVGCLTDCATQAPLTLCLILQGCLWASNDSKYIKSLEEHEAHSKYYVLVLILIDDPNNCCYILHISKWSGRVSFILASIVIEAPPGSEILGKYWDFILLSWFWTWPGRVNWSNWRGKNDR